MAKDPKQQPATAKAGQQLSARAASKLRKTSNYFEHFLKTCEACTIQPKSDAKNGQWICADCGEIFQNNMMAQNHSISHRRTWWTGEHFEEP